MQAKKNRIKEKKTPISGSLALALALLYATSGHKARTVETWIGFGKCFGVEFRHFLSLGCVLNLGDDFRNHFEVLPCHDVFDGFSFCVFSITETNKSEDCAACKLYFTSSMK